jgi:hypothetical protein
MISRDSRSAASAPHGQSWPARFAILAELGRIDPEQAHFPVANHEGVAIAGAADAVKRRGGGGRSQPCEIDRSNSPEYKPQYSHDDAPDAFS